MPRTAQPLRLEYLLLGLIRRGSKHGYELLQAWHEPNGIGQVWEIKPAVLYASLDKLEQLGYLEHRRLPQPASPARNEFSITPAGEEAFLAWLQSPVSAARDFRQDFIARLYFWQDVEPRVMSALINRQKEICQKWLVSLENQLDSVSGFSGQVALFRYHQVQSILQWLDELEHCGAPYQNL